MIAGLKAVGADKNQTPPSQEGNDETATASLQNNATELRVETEFVFSSSYRRDELDWNIAGNSSGGNPDILSELKWRDLDIFQLKFENRTVWPKIFYLRAYADYGWILDGKVQDSDYLGDNRAMEFSRSNNSADDGDVLDLSVGIGYPFQFGKTTVIRLVPLVGYSYHEQNLTLTDGNQTISTPGLTPPLGPFSGLDSTYETEWQGPWIGLDLIIKSKDIKSFAGRIESSFSIEYHWADYNAEADWNLREDFDHPKSFEHDADGTGIVVGVGFNFVLGTNWALNFKFDYQNWSTDHGTDRVYRANGRTAKTRLNEVNWESYALGLGLSLRF